MAAGHLCGRWGLSKGKPFPSAPQPDPYRHCCGPIGIIAAVSRQPVRDRAYSIILKVEGFHFGGLPPVGGTEPWKPCHRKRTEACPRAAERPHLGNPTLEIPSAKPPYPDRPLFRHQPGRYARHPANAPPEQAKFAGRNIPGIQRLVRHVKRRPFPDGYMPGTQPQISPSLFRGLPRQKEIFTPPMKLIFNYMKYKINLL